MRLTSKTFNALTQELYLLETVRLPAARQAVEESKLQGDNSQNNEYFVAAEDEAQARTRHALVVAAIQAHNVSLASCANKVGAGSQIVLSVGNIDEVYLYGSVEESMCWPDVVTPLSPIGKFLTDLEPGQSFVFNGTQMTLKSIVDRT